MKPRTLRRYERVVGSELRREVARHQAFGDGLEVHTSIQGNRWDVELRLEGRRPSPCVFTEGWQWHPGPMRYAGTSDDPAADAREFVDLARRIFSEAQGDDSLIRWKFEEHI